MTDPIIEQIIAAARERHPEATDIHVYPHDYTWTPIEIEKSAAMVSVYCGGENVGLYDAESIPALLAKLKEKRSEAK